MSEFVTLHPYRESGTTTQKESGEYIKNFFSALNLSICEQNFEYDLSQGYYQTPQTIQDRNIVARLNANSNQTVVVGAHYDNAFSSGKGQGAYDNGSGVGIMLALAESLVGANLPFNIEFVAFGGEEKGLLGSRFYLQNLATSDMQNILLYINLDSILAGDKVYMYCDEVDTIHQDYFVQIANQIGANISTYPTFKGVAGVYNQGDKLPYTHAGLMSDNMTFFNAGILTVSFSSYSQEKDELGQVNESMVFDNIMHTENDNLTVIEQLYADSAKQKMQDVFALLYNSLTSQDFATQMLYAKQNNPNYDKVVNGKLGAIISICVLAVFVIFLIILSDHFNKKAKKEILEKLKNVEKPEVFSDF